MPHKLIVLIVLYQKAFDDSDTLKSLLLCTEALYESKIIIWDNSPERVSFEEEKSFLSKFNKAIYLHTPENLALSKIYNIVIKTNNYYDFILLFDHDSKFTPLFFKKMFGAINKHKKINLFLPSVVSKGHLVSPGNLIIIKGKHWKKKKTGLIKANRKLAITSGMVIAFNYLNKTKYKFNERLNLYGIDTSFMIDFAKVEPYFYLFDYTLNHNTILWSEPPSEILLPRFRNLKKAWTIIFSENRVKKKLLYIYNTYLSIKMAIKYKDVRFLR